MAMITIEKSAVLRAVCDNLDMLNEETIENLKARYDLPSKPALARWFCENPGAYINSLTPAERDCLDYLVAMDGDVSVTQMRAAIKKASAG